MGDNEIIVEEITFPWTGRFECKEEVDAYLGGEDLQCLICGQAGFQMLQDHLSNKHGVTADAYRNRYGVEKGRILSTAGLIATLTVRAIANAKANDGKRLERAKARDWSWVVERLRAGEDLHGIVGRNASETYRKLHYDRQVLPDLDLEIKSIIAAARASKRGQWMDRLPALLESGWSVAKISELPGMPSAPAILTAMRRDPDLWRYAEGRAKTQSDPAAAIEEISPHDSAGVDWTRVMARVAAGELPFDIANGQGGMPTLSQWVTRARGDIGFAMEAQRRLAGQPTGRSRVGPYADKVVAAIAAGCPIRFVPTLVPVSVTAVLTWQRSGGSLGDRLAKAKARAAYRRRDASNVIVGRLTVELEAAGSIVAAGRNLNLPAGLVTRALRLADVAHAGPVAAIVQRKRQERSQARRLRMVRRPQLPLGESFNRLLRQNELYAAVDAVVPKHHPTHMRDDVRADMIADVIEGYLTIPDLKIAVRDYVADWNEMHGGYGSISFDEQAYDDGRMTIGDRISSEAAYARFLTL